MCFTKGFIEQILSDKLLTDWLYLNKKNERKKLFWADKNVKVKTLALRKNVISLVNNNVT